MSQSFDRHTAEFNARMLQACPVLSGADMDYWIGHPKELQAALSATLVRDVREEVKTFLSNCQVIDLPERPGVFNPNEFFTTRTGLYVWDGFRDRILAAARSTDGVPARQIASLDLLQKANDRDIRSELSEDHVFEVNEFLPHLAGMLERQWGGKSGSLLTNGYANLFYVLVDGEVFVVRVCWVVDSRKWGVVADPLDDGRWRAGRRFFSRTAAA